MSVTNQRERQGRTGEQTGGGFEDQVLRLLLRREWQKPPKT